MYTICLGDWSAVVCSSDLFGRNRSRDVGDAELGFRPEQCHEFVVTLSPLLVEKLFPDLLLGLLEGQRSARGAFHQLDDVMAERGSHRQARFSDLEGQEHLLKLRHRLALLDEP